MSDTTHKPCYAPTHQPPEMVTCYFSGEELPLNQAVLMRLGPGLKVWLHPRFCRKG